MSLFGNGRRAARPIVCNRRGAFQLVTLEFAAIVAARGSQWYWFPNADLRMIQWSTPRKMAGNKTQGRL
jgi:hypothetical protein